MREHGGDAVGVLSLLVQVVRKQWADCRSLSGAVQKYAAEAAKLWQRQRQRHEDQRQVQESRRQELDGEQRRQEEDRRRREAWERLPEEERQRVKQRVREKLGGSQAPEAFIHRFCLEEMSGS